MTDYSQHHADQAGKTNAVVGAIMAIAVASFIGAFWQAFNPIEGIVGTSISPFYRIAMLSILCGIAGASYVFVRTGGSDPASQHRAWYVIFRRRLMRNDALLPDAIANYAGIIRRVIHAVDRFLGDAGKAQMSAFPRGFAAIGLGLKRQAPLWTASAYMRCLLIALIYPLACILLIWGKTGHIGALEAALGMSEAENWVRIFSILAQFSAIFAIFCYLKAKNFKRWIWLALAVILPILAFHTGTISILVVISIPFILAKNFIDFSYSKLLSYSNILFPKEKFIRNIFQLAVLLFAVFEIFFVSTYFVGILSIICISIAGSGIFMAGLSISSKYKKVGFFLFIFTIIVILLTALIASAPEGIRVGVTFFYFVGLLTTINAPFDWIALGITRLLLRVGIQRAGTTPFVLALIDLLLSLLVMAFLAFALLWSTQIFNYLVVSRGGVAVLHVDSILNQLANPEQRGNVSLWWLYATLFSTQIPALFNLLVAGFCLMRGLPSMNRWMASQLPEEGPFNIWSCLSVSTVWAGQLALAMFIGLSAFYLLYFQGLVWIADGVFGTTLVDILRAVMLPIGQH